MLQPYYTEAIQSHRDALHNTVVLFQTITVAVIFGLGAVYDKITNINPKARVAFLIAYILYVIAYLVDVWNAFYQYDRTIAFTIGKDQEMSRLYEQFSPMMRIFSLCFHLAVTICSILVINYLLRIRNEGDRK